MSEKALREQYSRLQNTIKEKGFVMTTKRSLLCFRNAYVEMFTKLEEAKNDPEKEATLLAQIRVMSRISKLFSDHTDVIADEIDACLDVRKEVNFAMGENESLEPVKGNVGTRTDANHSLRKRCRSSL